MTKTTFQAHARHARIGNLGTLACSTSRALYIWLLREVYDLRFPRIGDSRHPQFPRTFDTLRHGARSRLSERRIAAARQRSKLRVAHCRYTGEQCRVATLPLGWAWGVLNLS